MSDLARYGCIDCDDTFERNDMTWCAPCDALVCAGCRLGHGTTHSRACAPHASDVDALRAQLASAREATDAALHRCRELERERDSRHDECRAKADTIRRRAADDRAGLVSAETECVGLRAEVARLRALLGEARRTVGGALCSCFGTLGHAKSCLLARIDAEVTT